MRILSVLLLLGITVCAYSERCPLYKKLRPCDCENLANSDTILVKCSYGKLEHLKQAFKSLVGKKNVDIYINGIVLGKLPSTLFKGIGVTHLKFHHCDLQSLTDDEDQPALVGLEDSLERLCIESSLKDDGEITYLNLKNMRKLTRLELIRNTIPKLEDHWVGTGPTSLEVLTLQDNKIEELGNNSFENLTNLKELYLDNNRLEDIQRRMLPASARRLRFLNLSKNKLMSLPKDIFSGMPALREVYLVNNHLPTLELDTWKPILEQLDYLDLEDNPVECDDHMEWIFGLRTPRYVGGTCAYPKDKRGTELRNFISEEQ